MLVFCADSTKHCAKAQDPFVFPKYIQNNNLWIDASFGSDILMTIGGFQFFLHIVLDCGLNIELLRV